MSFIFMLFSCSLLKHRFQDDLPWEHRLQSNYYFDSKYKTGKKKKKKSTNEFACILDKPSVFLPDLLGLFPGLLL